MNPASKFVLETQLCYMEAVSRDVLRDVVLQDKVDSLDSKESLVRMSN